MIDRVASALAGNNKIGVAVSGGADSVFLLTAIHELNLAAAILHVNHKLRGEESDADEAFVRQLAKQHDLPIHVAILPPAAGNTEQEARRHRYNFFAECIANGICDSVATGHTLDDQAETVLFRFLRGSGAPPDSTASDPPPPITSSAPLLNIRRDEIREYLTAHNIPLARRQLPTADENYQLQPHPEKHPPGTDPTQSLAPRSSRLHRRLGPRRRRLLDRRTQSSPSPTISPPTPKPSL